ncbi:MAG: hypothetical protein PWR01_418 [Clostridiales bacterium]|jgi:uncharacterized protein involved in tolerance to divalent cations|nr:hypothetical protein [Clostridiales bacterium]
MLMSVDKSFVLKTSSGNRWHFFLSPEQNIVYSQSDSQSEIGTTTQNVLLDSQPVKDLAATIDSSDNIHVLACTVTNHLVYYRWNGLKWQRQTVEYIRSPAQNISYFTIMAYQDIIHILYYIKGSLRRGTEFLIHYRGNGNKWTRQRTWTFASDSLTTIENAFIDNLGNVHLLFSQQSNNQPSLLYSCFSPSFSSWANPITIYKPGREYAECYLYADPRQGIHIIWKEKEGTNHIIRYLSVRSILQPESDAQESRVIYMGQDEPVHPTLLLSNQLYCLWEMKGDIYCTASQDGGNTWSIPRAIPHAPPDRVTFFYYTSFDRPDLPPTLRLWGINYKEVLDLSAPQATPNTTIAQKKEDQQLAYSKLEKRIAAIEHQLENITSSIYAFQEQLLQNGKAMYFLEAMIKKLNFQVEQLRTNSKQPFPYTDMPQKEKRPVPNKEQAYLTSSTPPSSMDDNATRSTSPSSPPIRPDSNVLPSSEGKQPAAQSNATAQPPQEAENSSQGTDSVQTPTAVQPKDAPNRITLGNVDIIINPQDEED